MAGEHSGDALFYDFLIEDPEIPAPTTMSTIPTMSNMPSTLSTSTPGATAFAAVPAPANIATDPPHNGHLQQPISAPNRTSPQPQRHLPVSNDPRDPRHPATIHVASPVAAAPLPAQAAHLQATHVAPQPTMPAMATFLPLELDPSSRAQSRPLLQSHHTAIHDLHAHHPQSSAPLATASFPASLSPISTTPAAPVAPGPVEWSMYGVHHPAMALNPSPFDFEVPGAVMMPSMSQHGHMSPAVSDPSLGYGGGIVSPSSIHSSQGHYGFSGSWDEHLVHESTTPTVSTPSGQVSTNPWTDPEDLQLETDLIHDTRPKKAARSRRTKKDAVRRSSDTRSGPSPDATSPGSTSQNSRASIGSKATSIASSSVASSSIASSSTSSSRMSKLRSASRTSKNSASKPSDTVEERRTRASHNLVEKQYRNRLNAQFESLLSALPEQVRAGGDSDSDNGWSDRKVSKGEVLEMARKHIQSLEMERDMLEQEKSELQGSLAQLKKSVASDGSGNDTPLDFNISMDDEQEDDQLN